MADCNYGTNHDEEPSPGARNRVSPVGALPERKHPHHRTYNEQRACDTCDDWRINPIPVGLMAAAGAAESRRYEPGNPAFEEVAAALADPVSRSGETIAERNRRMGWSQPPPAFDWKERTPLQDALKELEDADKRLRYYEHEVGLLRERKKKAADEVARLAREGLDW